MKPTRFAILAVAIAALMLPTGLSAVVAAQTKAGTSPKPQRPGTTVAVRQLPPATVTPPPSRAGGNVTPPPPSQTHDGNPTPPPARSSQPPVEVQCAVIVPNLVGQDLKAVASILGKRLSIGSVARRRAPGPPGLVIDQSPRQGSQVRCGSTISVLIAEQEQSECQVQVPDLVNAEGPARQILDSRRLTLGRIQSRPDPRPKGTIIAQSPARGTYVPCGTPVNVLVAVPFREPVDVVVADDKKCKVPSLIGRDEKQALELITGAQLRIGSVRRQESDQAGETILTQSFGPETIVKCNTAIDVVVAQRVTRVPLLTGNDVPAAGRLLTQSGLRFGKTLERESTAAFGTVVEQMPAANTIVNPDSPVDVWVAIRKPVLVPNLEGHDRASAGQTLADLGLKLIDLGKRESNEKADSVVGQVPAANTSVRFGAAVGVWLAVPVPPPPVASVPSLTGVAQTEALGLIGNAKLTPGAIAQRESSQTPGTVLDQRPAAGAEVQPGSAVNFTVAIPVRKSIVLVATPTAPPPVTVPDLTGKSQNEATASIQNLQLRVGPFGERESTQARGTVVAQDPAAGTIVEAGSLVSVSLAIPIVLPPVTVVPVVPPATPWWSLIAPWISTGALFVLAVAATATVKRVRRNRIMSTPTLVPHIDAGTQFSVPGDRDLTNFEMTLEARRDHGAQTLDCGEEFIAGFWSGKQEPSW